eukprot:5557131-Pyramimonas_sp.AAC.1
MVIIKIIVAISATLARPPFPFYTFPFLPVSKDNAMEITRAIRLCKAPRHRRMEKRSNSNRSSNNNE